jgi:hypothetical protein
VLGGVLADPVLAGVHQRGDLGGVGLACRVGDGGDARGPRACGERDHRAEAGAQAGVEDGGDVAGAGQVPFGDRVGENLGGVQAGEFGGVQGAPQPFRLLAGLPVVAGRQRVHQQLLVVLVAGGGDLGGPDRVQDGQVVGVGEGLVPYLGGGVLLAVAVQHASKDGERLSVRAGGCRLATGSAGEAVVAGKFGGRAGARGRIGAPERQGEHVREVDVGAAAQRDVSVRAVLGPGDHGQASMHGPALGGVVGDRIAELGIFAVRVPEGALGPAALPGGRVGVQGAAHDQALRGDGFDAEQVAVGQRPAGFAGFDAVVVTGANDQVAGAGLGAIGDGHRGPGWTTPRRMRSSRMRRFSSRRSAWSAAISRVSVPVAIRAT